ncbi:MAG: hypothetical protein M2R45_04162 [Verrucomicrobia subdivision 3 bacterium]|nr:hypothetical protein [Limisphaerales bacterium]
MPDSSRRQCQSHYCACPTRTVLLSTRDLLSIHLPLKVQHHRKFVPRHNILCPSQSERNLQLVTEVSEQHDQPPGRSAAVYENQPPPTSLHTVQREQEWTPESLGFTKPRCGTRRRSERGLDFQHEFLLALSQGVDHLHSVDSGIRFRNRRQF